MLNLQLRVEKGPLYHVGEVRFTGLNPDLEARARQLWKPKAGDPYDFLYPQEFFQAFSRAVELRNSRFHAATQKGAGDHVIDINLVFEPR